MGDSLPVPALPTPVGPCDLQTRILDVEVKTWKIWNSTAIHLPCGASIELGACLAGVMGRIWMQKGLLCDGPHSGIINPLLMRHRGGMTSSQVIGFDLFREIFFSIIATPKGNNRDSGDMISDA